MSSGRSNFGSTTPEDEYKVWEFKELSRERNREEARAMLERVCKQVQPLMRRRRWRVKRVREFYPSNPSLLGLNVNKGSEVRVRLRQPGYRDSFFPYEHVLGTMLHELCHNVVGPHNAAFYKLLDEITEECERDMANGVFGTGAGFDSRGVRLGGRGPVPVHNPNPIQLRQKMVAAAEARAKKQRIMSSGPQRLGGSTSFASGLTTAQAAAKAAERRMRDNLWCGIETIDLSDEKEEDYDDKTGPMPPAPAAADEPHVCVDGCCSSQVVDLTMDDSDGEEEVSMTTEERKERAMDKWGGATTTTTTTMATTRAAAAQGEEGPSAPNPPKFWSCAVCTLHNPLERRACDACGTPQIAASGSGGAPATAPPTEAPPNGPGTWNCKFCTLVNAEKDSHCRCCNNWRFSNGYAPVTNVIKWNQT